MPGLLALDDDEIGLRIKPGANGGDGLFGDEAFELLALAVACVEALGERQSLGEVAGEQEVERFFGSFESASGVKPWSELKADFMDADGGGRTGHLFQGDKARAPGFVQALQAGRDKNAIFAEERDEVSDSAKSD
jgi:hypothetical protein